MTALWLALLATTLLPRYCDGQDVRDGSRVRAPVVPFGERGELHICSSSIVRVTHRPTAAQVSKNSLVARSFWTPVNYTTHREGDKVVVETSELVITAIGSTGQVAFSRRTKQNDMPQLILQEESHSFTMVQDMGKNTYQIEQSWADTNPAEALYGGGSYQNGLLNFKHAPVQMLQYNTEAVVPFFVSSDGYGLLWDNYAWSFLNPPKVPLVEVGGNDSGVAEFTAPVNGDYFFYWGSPFPKAGDKPPWGGHAKRAMVDVEAPDGSIQSVISWDRLANSPASLTGRAERLTAGVQYKVHYSWTSNAPRSRPGLYVQGPEYGGTVLRSAIGELIDYYFVVGIGDEAMAGYRQLTGAAPLYSRWVYGFWQCKERYDTQQHLLEAAHGFTNLSIPVDAFVQDWHYWGSLGWGPHWDPDFYPNPAGMVNELHSLGIHLMVSVWSKFDGNTNFYKVMKARGWMLGESGYYDAWDPDARTLFYNFSNASHFSIGVDSLWLDATEPEGFPNVGTHTHLGSGNALMNSYSLLTTEAIADGLRRDYPHAQGARVFSLTRSSFAGQQRTGAALWTGDISGNWDSLRRQVASSLNYALSGMPYWSEDIGGFFRPKEQYVSEEYHDLLTRWFQFGVFTPIFRVHGAGTKTELWNFGEQTMRNINASAISLRYRLLPYIYSGFARVERESYTMQRPLVMHFPKDERAQKVADEFMWGDALLVAPILQPSDPKCRCTSRRVYLPPAATWTNFHSGESHPSGDSEASFALSEAPVFVRGGSIVVMGPFLQRTADISPSDPLEVRVYPGGDGSFTLWEDDGFTRAYQRGDAASVQFTWSEKKGELTIGAQQGTPPPQGGRLVSVVFVRPGHGIGVPPSAQADAVVCYEGRQLAVKRPVVQAVFWV